MGTSIKGKKGRRGWVLLGALLAALLVGSVLAGCGQATRQPKETPKQEVQKSGTPGGEQKPAKPSQPAQKAKIVIAGSTSVQPISELLAEAFMAKNQNVEIAIQGGGSSAGIKAAAEGAADIGASSRELKESEKNLNRIEIARDGVVIVVHPSNPVSDLRIDQIRDIYSGKITNWKQVGGKDAQITAITRESGSGTRGAFEEIVTHPDKISDKCIVQNSTGAIRAAVAQDPNAIGYISLASLSKEVKAMKVEGVEATADNIKSGSYKVNRPFLYLTKEKPSGIVKDYIDFVLGPEGKSIMEKEGLVVK